MIEFIRRSLIEKALEGEMKIIAAGSFVNSSGQSKSFTVAEGKTTLTIAYFGEISQNMINIGEGVAQVPCFSGNYSTCLKGVGDLLCPAHYCRYNGGSYTDNFSFIGNSSGIGKVSSSSITCNSGTSFSYIIFEIDE